MNGIRPRRLLLQVTPGQEKEPISIAIENMERTCNIVQVRKSLSDWHRDVSERIDTRRRRAIEVQIAKINIFTPQIFVSDLVVICKPKQSPY